MAKVPKEMKKCIKDFLSHLSTLEAEDDPDGNGINREYRLIHEAQVRNRRDNKFEMEAGRKDNNVRKNRYKDILPYDEHRITLKEVEGEEDCDYINASKLMGVRGTGGYIASQGPLAATVNDYWRMVWEYKVDIIFMACRIVELGKIKCKQYWNDQGKSDEFGDFTVYTEKEEEVSSDFVRRQFKLTHGDEERNVIQFHYSGWPDHGIPKDAAHIRDLIRVMREARLHDEHPLLVHCSAGCGRTGAIVAIDYVWTLLEEGKFDESFNLFDLVCNFRLQRMSIVQTAEQYNLVYQVLRSLCEDWLVKMASHTYVNVELGSDQNDQSDQVYQNVEIGSDKPKEIESDADHIYYDSVVLKDKLPEKETKLSPVEKPVVEDGLVTGAAAAGGGAPTPDIISVVPPSERSKAKANNAYENVTVLQQKEKDPEPEAKKPAQKSPSKDKDSGSPKQHSTVIQIGSGVQKDQSPTSTGGGNQVFYLYGKEKRQASQSSTPPLSPKTGRPGVSTSSMSSLGSQPSSPAANKPKPPAPISSPPPRQGSIKSKASNPSTSSTDNDPSSLYAKVTPRSERDDGSSSKHDSLQRTGSNKSDVSVFSNDSTKSSATNASAASAGTSVSAGSSGGFSGRSVSMPGPPPVHHPVQRNISGPIPGFDDRLPRVRGPVPQPKAWDSSS